MKLRILIVSDQDEHDVPYGWRVMNAFPLRTTGAQATIGVLLVKEQEGWHVNDV